MNLAEVEEKKINFLLDEPVSPSELFDTSIRWEFQRDQYITPIYATSIPRHSRSTPQASKEAWPVFV